MFLRNFLIALSQNAFMKRLVSRNFIARRVARRYVAGETWEDAVVAMDRLQAEGMDIALDFLGENVHTPAEADRATEEYLKVLQNLRQRGQNWYISLKLTQIGMDLGEDLCLANLERVLTEAALNNTFVRVDMEGSQYTELTLRIVERAAEKHSNVGIVIQSYLRRSRQDIARMNQLGIQVRLCKGAYSEPASVAFQKKSEVDANYVTLMEDLMAAGHHPALATHDEAMIQATINCARRHAIPAEAFEFQMLSGIRKERQSRLRQEGFRMRVYVAFGTEWYPYFMRRLAERPANLLFFLTALIRG